MRAIEILGDATIRAAILHGRARGIEFEAGRLSEIARSVLKSSISEILSDWEELLSANVGERWIREFVNAQANELAVKILEVY